MKWVKFCKRSDTFNPATSYICSRHFETSAYERNLKYELLDIPEPPAQKKFKPGATPTLYSPHSDAPPEVTSGGARTPPRGVADAVYHQGHCSITDEQDHPAEVMKPPHVDVQVVEVKEEPTWTEEAHDMLQQDPLALNPEPVSWQFSDSQEEPQPQGRVIYLKEEIDIKEEDVDSFSMEEVAECVTDRGGSLLQGPQKETEKLPVKRRKAMKAEV